jgi:signal transduction histidine kinase
VYLKFARLLWHAKATTGEGVPWPVFGPVGLLGRAHVGPKPTRRQRWLAYGAISASLVAGGFHQWVFWAADLAVPLCVVVFLVVRYTRPLLAQLAEQQSQLIATEAALATARERERNAAIIAAQAAELDVKNQALEQANRELLIVNEDLDIAYFGMREANEKLDQHNELVRRANHDVLPLLTVIRHWCKTLEGTGLNERQQYAVGEILGCNSTVAERLEKIIGMEHLAKLREGSPTAAVELEVVLDPMIEPYMAWAEEHGSQFAVRGNYWCTVWANAEYLVRIISNLVKNAIVHNPPGTRVHVMVSRRRRFTVIRVLDTGRGIPEARGAKPLENFAAFVARCAQTGATGGEGSHGIGIASVATLCAELNGHMRLYARCHVGTIFELMLEPARMPVK